MLRRTEWIFGSLAVLFLAVSVAAQEKGGYLKVKAQPGRTGVFVDGKYLGPAANFRIARTYSVPAGEHELSLKYPRYQEFTAKVTVNPGKTTVVSQMMKPLDLIKPPYGALKTKGFKYDAVYVNGMFMGHVDEFDGPCQKLLLNPGEYQVQIVPVSGGKPSEEKIKIEANHTVVVREQ